MPVVLSDDFDVRGVLLHCVCCPFLPLCHHNDPFFCIIQLQSHGTYRLHSCVHDLFDHILLWFEIEGPAVGFALQWFSNHLCRVVPAQWIPSLPQDGGVQAQYTRQVQKPCQRDTCHVHTLHTHAFLTTCFCFLLLLERLLFKKNCNLSHTPLPHRVTKVLKATVHALENNNISYWANGGTLLGVYLNQSIIAWDYDADLFLPCTLRTLEKIRWGDYGLVSYTGWDGMVRIKSSRFSSIRVDLFMVHFKADGRQWFNDDLINIKYPKENLLTINDVYPLRLYNMTRTSVESGFQLWGPSHPQIVLQKLYPGRSTKLDPPKTTGGIFRYLELQMFTRFGNVFLFKESTFPGKHTLSVAHLLLHNRAVLVRENNIDK